MKKCVVAILCFSLALLSFTVHPLSVLRSSLVAEASPDDSRSSGGREYSRDEIRAYERREREARDATRNARQNLAASETALATAQGKQDEAEARLESWRTANRISESNLNRVPEDVRIEYEERRQKAAAAAREVTAATARRDASRLELNAAIEEQRTAEENTQLAQANCSDCGGRNRPQQQTQITSLYPPESTTAQIIRALGGAVGPVAIAGLGAYTSVQAINSQSGDYRQYLNNATALGLPAYPPNGYGGAYGAALGPSLWGVGAMAGYGGGGYLWGGPFIAGAGAGIYANAGIYGGAYPGYPYGGGAYPGYPYGGGGYYPAAGIQLGAGYLVGAIGAPYSGGSFGVPYMPIAVQPGYPGYPYGGGAYPGYPYAGGGAYPQPYAGAGFQFGFPGPGNTYASPFTGYNAYNYGGLQGYNPWLQQTQMQTQYGMQSYYQQQYMNAIAYQQLGAQLQQQAGVASARLADAQSYYNYTMSMLQTQYYNGYTASYGTGYGYTYGGGNSFRGGGVSYGVPYQGNSYGVNDFRGGGGGGVYPAGGGIPPIPAGGIPTPYPAGGTPTGNTGGFPRR